MSKLRICFVMRFHPAYKVGGAEIQAWFLAKELAGRGWESHYVFGHEHPYPREEICEGVYLHRRKLLRREIEVLGYRSLFKILEKIDAHIYYQRVALPLTEMVSRFAASHNRKFVWSSANVHDCIRDKFTRNKRMGPIHRFLFGRLNNFLYTRGIQNADLIISQSYEQYGLLKQSFHKESVVIRNGWPLPQQSVYPKEDPPLLLWVANLIPWKRPELFIKLAKLGGTLRARFMMIGGGENTCLKYIAAETPQLPNFEYKGVLPVDEVNRFMEKASIFVNTSEREGFPNTFIQAWMRETPTVSLCVDPDNIIEKNNLGFCSGSFDKLVEDIRTLLLDRHLREEMGRNARRYAATEHNITKNAERFELSLLKLLGE